MQQSGHLNPSEETGTGCPITSEYGRTTPNKHGGVGRQQQCVTWLFNFYVFKSEIKMVLFLHYVSMLLVIIIINYYYCHITLCKMNYIVICSNIIIYVYCLL